MKKTLLILLTFLFGISYSGIGQSVSKSLNPPANLKAEHVLDNPNVYLTWWAPGTPFWLHYDSGEYFQSIGLNEVGEFDVAIAYEPSQLLPYQGMQVTKFAFTPSEPDAIYIFKIWTGTVADSVIYQDTLSDLIINAWNIIVLDSTVTIEANQIYFFGYHVNGQGGYPAGCDGGPVAVPSKSDLIRTEAGPFYSLYDLGLDLNPNIEVYLEPVISTEAMLVAKKDFTEYSNFKLTDIKKQVNKESIPFDNEVKTEIPNSYIVYRNDASIGTTTEPEYHDVLPESGIFTYEVSAVYNAGESEKSEAIEVLYDNSRIPINTVVTEAFINVGTYTGDNGDEIANSPSSPGVFKGIFELNYEVEKIASINYHSATAILGYDEFATEFSETRFMDYFMTTWAFPMAIFNGDLFIGGGSDESLHDAYVPVYEEALNRLTPIAFDCNLEKSGAKYLLHANADMVGIYPTQNLVLHTVLTRDSIYHEWNGGKIEQVRYVATGMFPNVEGTAIDFTEDGTASATVEVEVDPFADIDNYRVIAFIQDKSTFQILNGFQLKIPKKRAVTFTVLDGNNPVEEASIVIDGTTLTTDNQGKSAINLWDNQGEVAYSITKDGYLEHMGVFNMDTTIQVMVNLLTDGIGHDQDLVAQVYPNPAKTELFILSNSTLAASVFDVSGKEVIEIGDLSNTKPLDISGLERGIYFLSIKNGGKQTSYKFIKE